MTGALSATDQVYMILDRGRRTTVAQLRKRIGRKTNKAVYNIIFRLRAEGHNIISGRNPDKTVTYHMVQPS